MGAIGFQRSSSTTVARIASTCTLLVASIVHVHVATSSIPTGTLALAGVDILIAALFRMVGRDAVRRTRGQRFRDHDGYAG